MRDPNCAIEVGTHVGPYWSMDGQKTICDRHKKQYDNAYDDYSHINWTFIGDV